MAVVTIYTGASFCPETGAAGWAAWIRRDDEMRILGDSIRRPLEGKLRAEMASIANGIAAAVRDGLIESRDLVVVVTDSHECIEMLSDADNFHAHPSVGSIMSVIHGIASRTGFRIKINENKTSSDGKRSFVNRKVDNLSYEHMKTSRKKILENKSDFSQSRLSEFAPLKHQKQIDVQNMSSAFGMHGTHKEVSALTPNNPIVLPWMSSDSPLGVMIELSKRGWIKRSHLTHMLEIASAHLMHTDPKSYVKSCVAMRLQFPEQTNIAVPPTRLAEYLSSRSGFTSDLQEMIDDGRFIDISHLSQDAASYAARCVRNLNRDGVVFEDGINGPTCLVFASDLKTQIEPEITHQIPSFS